MAQSRRGSGFRSRSGQRRSTFWDAGPGGTGTTALSASTVALIGASVTAALEGVTIVRIRGLLRLTQTLATNAGDGFRGAFGIGIATLAAVTAGIGSIPTPISEQGDENWLFWHVLSVTGPVVSSTEANSPASFQEIVIDSRAMRKFPVGMALYVATEVVEVGTATADLTLDTRLLGKLP